MEEEKALRIPDTREKIQMAFVKNYACKPLSKITVREITEQCGISRGTFYSYFEDMPSVLCDLEDTFLERLTSYMSTIIIQGALRNRDDYINNYSKMLKFIAWRPKMFCALIQGSERVSFLEKFRKRIAEGVKTLLALEKKENSEYWDRVCSFHGGGVVALLQDWIESGMKLPPEEVAAIVYNALFSGLCDS